MKEDHKKDWDNMLPHERSKAILKASLKKLRTVVELPDMPVNMSEYLGYFEKSIHLLPRNQFVNKALAHSRDALHPTLHVFLTPEEVASKNAIVLRTWQKEYKVLVDNSYAATDDAQGFFFELLAEEFGHIATSVHERINTHEISESNWHYAGAIETQNYIRKYKELSEVLPDSLEVHGFRATLYDGRYRYISPPRSVYAEELRAQFIAQYLTIKLYSLRFGGFDNALKILTNNAKELENNKTLYVIGLGNKLGWDKLLPICVNGTMDDFVKLGREHFSPEQFEEVIVAFAALDSEAEKTKDE